MNAKSISSVGLGMLAALSLASTTVPAGTPVTLKFDQAVNSRHAKVGDKIKMHVATDVIVNGETILRAGTPAWAEVDSVKKNERFGINAQMKLDVEDIHGIPLKGKDAGKLSGSRADHAALAAGGGALILGPIGLLGSYFVVGKPLKIKPGQTFQTVVATDTVVQ
ncbi:MAG TPA: hypothetical protein VGL56_16495 [Fimbriimonadaceae bacterium]|jgi:hypothetical protein